MDIVCVDTDVVSTEEFLWELPWSRSYDSTPNLSSPIIELGRVRRGLGENGLALAGPEELDLSGRRNSWKIFSSSSASFLGELVPAFIYIFIRLASLASPGKYVVFT